MRVFVSGQLGEKESIREVYALLEGEGHVITHDWTQTDNLPKPYIANQAEAGMRAAKDIDGVLEADAYVIVTDNQRCGKGMYVELGVALAKARLGQIRDVAIVGRKNHESIFYYHPSLNHFDSIEDYIAHLARLSELQMVT